MRPDTAPPTWREGVDPALLARLRRPSGIVAWSVARRICGSADYFSRRARSFAEELHRRLARGSLRVADVPIVHARRAPAEPAPSAAPAPERRVVVIRISREIAAPRALPSAAPVIPPIQAAPRPISAPLPPPTPLAPPEPGGEERLRRAEAAKEGAITINVPAARRSPRLPPWRANQRARGATVDPAAPAGAPPSNPAPVKVAERAGATPAPLVEARPAPPERIVITAAARVEKHAPSPAAPRVREAGSGHVPPAPTRGDSLPRITPRSSAAPAAPPPLPHVASIRKVDVAPAASPPIMSSAPASPVFAAPVAVAPPALAAPAPRATPAVEPDAAALPRPPAAAEIEIDLLADRVERRILKNLALERERRGDLG